MKNAVTEATKAWEQLKEWNVAYRIGAPIISDQRFDDELEAYIKNFNLSELEVRSALMDIPGKVKHDFVCGSLKKTKAEDDSFEQWWKKEDGYELFTSAKVDGMSIVVKFEDGNYVSAITRGDGEFGENQTDKCRYIVPGLINSDFTGTIRGELTLTNATFEILKTQDTSREHKNLRNSTCGVINQRTLRPELCELVSFIAYEIVDSPIPRFYQIYNLSEMGFETPMVRNMYNPTREKLVERYKEFVEESDYMVDGLVMHPLEWVSENDKYYPLHARAFKVNENNEDTEIIEIEWNLGKSGNIIPVGIVNPVELEGTTVRRVTLCNARYVVDNNIEIGTKVTLIKSGAIIPRIIAVEGVSII